MAAIYAVTAFAIFVALTFAAWRRYLWVARSSPRVKEDADPYSLTDVFGDRHLIKIPHQKGIIWLNEVFSRSAKKYPNLTALQIPHTGESLTYSELDARAEHFAAAIAPYLTGPDQVVAVAMSQDNWQIVAAHLAILKAGGTLMFLDTTLPDALLTHMLNDAQPVLILTRGETRFRDLPTLDLLSLPEKLPRRRPPTWLDDPTQRLASIFYTSGTTGMPRGVECAHAGYINLALSYADYFDLVPGMDATTLTSSLGYDGSISELYSAWVSGCAVVLLTKEEVRSGPDLVPILRDAEVTVLFCPPVLLTTLTSTPELDLPYPICRYIVPAGEAFPAALVEPWTRARRQIINTYGPTEASTDTSRQSLRPGDAITIGSPFANVTYAILEVDGLTPLPLGEEGELCIGGVHLARGYRNLPEQTEQKFITHPRFGRLYRTGDRCRIDTQTHRVHFLGRIDAQLKVRGHRVEAQAVEDILQAQFGEIEAAVLDYQNEALIAFVSAPSVAAGKFAVAAPAPAEWATRVTATLAGQLPGPSVPDRIFLVEKFVMKPVSGKIDRKCLPNLAELMELNGFADAIHTPVNHHTALEPNGFDHEATPEEEEVLAICRAVFENQLALDDGFAEAGGHSILIARLAHQLHKAGWRVSVRSLLSDCNSARKVAARQRVLPQETIASPVHETANDTQTERDEAAAEVLPVTHFTALQILFATLLYGPVLAAFLIVLSEFDVSSVFLNSGLVVFVVVGLVLYLAALATPFLALAWVMILKLFLSGHVYRNKTTPGVYPKWSKMHLRIWCIGRMENAVLQPFGALYRSAPLLAFALRQLGARVGRNLQCAPDATLTGPLDLLSTGDNVAIQTGAQIHTTRWLGQFLQVGPVGLESGCKIGMRAAVNSNVTVGRGSWVTPFTPIMEETGPHEMWEGAPAVRSGGYVELKRTANACRYRLPVWLLETLNILLQAVASFFLTAAPAAAVFWFSRGLVLIGDTELAGASFAVRPLAAIVGRLILYAFVTTWVTIVIVSVLNSLFIRFTAGAPGLYPSRGLRGALLLFRMGRMNALQRQWTWTMTGQYLRALAGVRFARVGASECDVMFNLVPEMAAADAQVFWSNGCYTNQLDYSAGHFVLRQLEMPRNFFSGNNSVAEYGNFPSNFLLGVSTPASEIEFRRQLRSRPDVPVTVAGNPPMQFSSAALDANGGEELPTFWLFLSRIFLNDLFAIGLLPLAEALIFTLFDLALSQTDLPPAVSVAMALVLSILVLLCGSIAVKKLLVGKWGSDHATPFWSLRHFAYFFAQDCFFAWCRWPLWFLTGTTAANFVLRRMGCRIGRRTIVTEPMQCFDWNAVSVADDCLVDGYMQYHTFENMRLKVKRTEVGAGCTVNAGATVMGGAVIEPNTTVAPMSLVLKEMNLLTGVYEGSPAQLMSDPPLCASMPAVAPSRIGPRIVDNTDWLKAAAIILVLVDHFGYFFMENDSWWGAFGRFAAPVFFFLVGYAKTRKVPAFWIALGVLLTVLDSWNADWDWVAPNILLSFAIIRVSFPYVEKLVRRYPWAALVLLFPALLGILPFAAKVVDYGVEGWMWALFGLYHRQYVDGKSIAANAEGAQASSTAKWVRNTRWAGLVLCLWTAVVYVWQEQKEFAFPPRQLTVVIVGVCIMSICLVRFFRGPSRIQPPASIANVLSFVGRHTLEIYAVQLAFSEIIVKLFPSLSQ